MADEKRSDPIRDFESTLLRKLKETKEVDPKKIIKHEEKLSELKQLSKESSKKKRQKTIELRREINELVKKQHNKTSQKRKKEIEKLQKIKEEHQATKNIYSPFIRSERNKLRRELGFTDYDLYISDGFEQKTMKIKELLATGRPDIYLLKQYKKNVKEALERNKKLTDEEWKKIFKNTEKKDWLDYTERLLDAIQSAIDDLEGNRDVKDTDSGYIRINWTGNVVSLEFSGWSDRPKKKKERKKKSYGYRKPWNKGKRKPPQGGLDLDDDIVFPAEE